MSTEFTFHFILADNDVNKDGNAFTDEALQEICKICIGQCVRFDGTGGKSKITSASIMDSDETTSDGRHKHFIQAEAKLPNNAHEEELINSVLFEKPTASISCSVLNADKITDSGTMISNVTDFSGFRLDLRRNKKQ